MAKYRDLDEVEEYIDLISILQNLYYDIDDFLEPIKEVRIEDATVILNDKIIETIIHKKMTYNIQETESLMVAEEP